MTMMTRIAQSLGAFVAGLHNISNGIAGLDANAKISGDVLPDSVVRTDGNGLIGAEKLPGNVVYSDGNGKIPVGMLDLGADAGLWNFVGGVDGGVDAANATDLTLLAEKDPGDAYLVETAGWFSLGVAGDEFELPAGNAIAFTASGGIVQLGNSDLGTVNEFETALTAAYQAAL